MSTLVITLPNTTQAALQVAANTLVYDGHDFVEPIDAQYVMLYSTTVAALNLPFVQTSINLHTTAYVKAGVVSYSPLSTPSNALTDPTLVSEIDPSNGVCICFITCTGTDLRYVKVTIS